LERELRKEIRYQLNTAIDRTFHPVRRYDLDFMCHYMVEKLTGLSDEVILLKALKYYKRR
jgi:hypothetical protein